MSKWFRKKVRQWKKINFKKKIIVFSILFIVAYTIAQTYMSYNLGIELSPTLTACVYAFFGTELAACALIQVCEKKETTSNTKYNNPTKEDDPVG